MQEKKLKYLFECLIIKIFIYTHIQVFTITISKNIALIHTKFGINSTRLGPGPSLH